MSRIRIVATIGPVTNNSESLRALARAGMNVARLNGSHADLAWHADAIALIRTTLAGIPILFDIPGRKIRTAQLAKEPRFDKGGIVVLTTGSGADGGKKVPINHPTLHEELSPGDTILADDGTLRFSVEKIVGRDIYCIAETAGRLGSRKGINLPFVTLKTRPFTDLDREMTAFACDQGVDFIGISFVDSATHVNAVRELVGGDAPRIVAKIECKAGLDHLDEILEVTDAVMIDRGDLSVEASLDQLALFQKRIISAAARHGKPVIVATEMLHTMIENPVPTKAEVSDITNAVLDGCAATMLSGETAIGKHAVEAVAVMRRIADASAQHRQFEMDAEAARNAKSVPQGMGDAIGLICRELPVTKIVAITKSGYAARMVAARQPRQPILAVSNDASAARSFNLFAGTEGIFVDIPFSRGSTDHIAKCLEYLWRSGKLIEDDLILVTSLGYPGKGRGTRMNLIQTHYVADLVSALGWVAVHSQVA